MVLGGFKGSNFADAVARRPSLIASFCCVPFLFNFLSFCSLSSVFEPTVGLPFFELGRVINC